VRFDPYPLLRRGARRAGFHLVRANYYSPIPDVDALPDDFFDEPRPMPGVDLRVEASLEQLEQELGPLIAAWRPTRWHPANPMYGALDGEVLYAMVRHLQPEQVLEIGGGWSSLCIADAAPARHDVVDPFPAAVLDGFDVWRVGATDIPLARFDELRSGDILFIDTTHTVKPGSDVNYLLLEVLPRLAPGVVVHVHDFFRPFEYPRPLFDEFGVYWQEHYLLQALLVGGTFEVLMANHALARLHPERVRAVVPSLTAEAMPSALWLRKV
jgi:hypothetical protein